MPRLDLIFRVHASSTFCNLIEAYKELQYSLAMAGFLRYLSPLNRLITWVTG
jgi:hypothetical protein